MSERGSFVTEYIMCDKCLAVAKQILLNREKDLCSTMIPTWEKRQDAPRELPIIAGKCSGSYPGGEIMDFELNYVERLRKKICHQLRIVVLAASGNSRIFNLSPGMKEVNK